MRLDIPEAKALENTWRKGGKEAEVYSCIIESFRYSALVVDQSTSNTSDPHLYSLSEIKATIILRVRGQVSVSVFHPRTTAWMNVPVEIVEEGQQVESKLDETFLLVSRQRPENFRCVVHVVFITDPVGTNRAIAGEYT